MWTMAWMVRCSMPLMGAVYAVALDTDDAAKVSAKPSHQRTSRFAELGQLMSSSVHSEAPDLHAMRKYWNLALTGWPAHVVRKLGNTTVCERDLLE